ncbi:MAG TPA: hypothetical protein VMG10_32615 [Gemmataceae bacterium]|nr:hypothetical protein [Gemmataceae bacterium]
MRTWTRLIPAVLLILPFAPGLLRAADADTKAIEQLQKDVKKLQDDVQKLQNEMTTNSVRGATMAADLHEILRRLDGLAKQQETIERISRYGPPAGTSNAPPPPSATITLENQYSDPAQVTINGLTYTVQAFRTIQVPRPAGSFVYSVEVNGFLAQSPSTVLTPGGFRIRIFPRMPY